MHQQYITTILHLFSLLLLIAFPSCMYGHWACIDQTEVSACIMFMHAIDLQQAHIYCMIRQKSVLVS